MIPEITQLRIPITGIDGWHFELETARQAVLEQLRVVSDVLSERRFDLMDTLTTVASFVASLGEAVASARSVEPAEIAAITTRNRVVPFEKRSWQRRSVPIAIKVI